MPLEWTSRGTSRAPVLVADEDRLPVAAQDEQGLLEPRIKAVQVRDICAVLSVGIDDEGVEPARPHSLAQARESSGVYRGGDFGLDVRGSVVGKIDPVEARPPRRSAVHWASGAGCAPRSTTYTLLLVTGCQSPFDPSGHVMRTSAVADCPSPKWTGTSSPLTCPPPMVSSRCWTAPFTRTSIHAPIASLLAPESSSCSPTQLFIGSGESAVPDPTLR